MLVNMYCSLPTYTVGKIAMKKLFNHNRVIDTSTAKVLFVCHKSKDVNHSIFFLQVSVLQFH